MVFYYLSLVACIFIVLLSVIFNFQLLAKMSNFTFIEYVRNMDYLKWFYVYFFMSLIISIRRG